MSVRLLVAMSMLACVAGCGLMAERQERNEAEVIGKRLVAAGFRALPADTHAKREQLAALPNLLFATKTTKSGKRRWLLADPDRCRCLYVGDDAAYQRYGDMELAAEGVKSDAADKRADELAGVNDTEPIIDAYEIDVVMEGQSE